METPTKTPADGREILNRVYYRIWQLDTDEKTHEANCEQREIVVECFTAVTKASQADLFVRFADGEAG